MTEEKNEKVSFSRASNFSCLCSLEKWRGAFASFPVLSFRPLFPLLNSAGAQGTAEIMISDSAAAVAAAAASSSNRAWSSWALDLALISAPATMAVASMVARKAPVPHGLLLSALRAPSKLSSVFCLISTVSLGKKRKRHIERREAQRRRERILDDALVESIASPCSHPVTSKS